MNNSPQQILLFGASGRTGSILLKKALQAGHYVTAVVRCPEKIEMGSCHLRIVRGDSTLLSTFKEAARGMDLIISCIGVASNAPTTLYSKSISNMLEVMKLTGIRRIICVSAAGIETSPKLPLIFRIISRHFVRRIFRHPYADNRLMEKILRESNMNWTSVRPPMLHNKAATGRYRYCVNDWLERCYRINRADLASFLLENIHNKAMYRAVVEVAN